MKTASSVLIFAILLFVLVARGQVPFQNLDFESANVAPLAPGEFGWLVPFSDALPGWAGYFGVNPATEALHNNVTLGGYNISILGPYWSFPGGGIPIIEGSYTAVLQAGLTWIGQGPPLPATIAQTGFVPSAARSIQMKIIPNVPNDINGLLVTLGGRTITMFPLQGGYSGLFGGDISSLAGQTEELRISALPLPMDSNTTLELDSIVFSPQTVPEPKVAAVVLLAVLVAFHRRLLAVAVAHI